MFTQVILKHVSPNLYLAIYDNVVPNCLLLEAKMNWGAEMLIRLVNWYIRYMEIKENYLVLKEIQGEIKHRLNINFEKLL